MAECITLIIIALIFLIYSIWCSKKKRVIYTVNSPRFTVLDEGYFELQLRMSIFNSDVMIIGGVLTQFFYDVRSMIFVITIFIFWIINYCLRWIAIYKGLCTNKK